MKRTFGGVGVVNLIYALMIAWICFALQACGGGGSSSKEGDQQLVSPIGAVISKIDAPSSAIDGAFTFTASASGGNGSLTYRWSFGDGETGSGESVTHNYSAAGTFDVTLTVLDSGGRSATATSTVRVDLTSPVQIRVERREASVGQMLHLSATLTAVDAASYEWSLGDGRTATGPTVDVQYVAQGGYTVTLTVVSTDGRRRSATADIKVVAPAPDFTTIDVSPKTVYVGSKMQVQVVSADAMTPVQWDFGDGSQVTAPPFIHEHVYKSAGTYILRLARTNSTGVEVSATATVTVLPPPQPSAKFIQVVQDMKDGSARARLWANSLEWGDGENGMTYVWSFGDGSTQAVDATSVTEHRYSAPGQYVVTVTATNAYGLSTTATATVAVSNFQSLEFWAGQGILNSLIDGPALSARFKQPGSLSFDANGNLFVSDYGNSAIRMVSPQGIVSTRTAPLNYCISGTRSLVTIRLSAFGEGNLVENAFECGTITRTVEGKQWGYGGTYQAVTADPQGVIYQVRGWTAIAKVDLEGKSSDVAGEFGSNAYVDGDGMQARFIAASQLGADAAGNVYIYDSGTVRKLSVNGKVSTVAGVAGEYGLVDAKGTDARFRYTSSFTVAPNGTVFLTDSQSRVVREVSPEGVVRSLPYPRSRNVFWSDDYRGMAVSPSGLLYMSDPRDSVIWRLDVDGEWRIAAGQVEFQGRRDGVGADAAFWHPRGMVQGKSGAVYVADSNNRAVRKIVADGTVTTLAEFPSLVVGIYGNGPPGDLEIPEFGSLAVDVDENVYVADGRDAVVRKIFPDGSSVVLAGAVGQPGFADGHGGAARFYAPNGISLDAAGNVYVADTFNQVIRKITPNGVVTTVAGRANVAGYADGAANQALFGYPTHVLSDESGNLWVSDFGNRLIRRVMTDGTTTTVAGRVRTTGSGDGMLGEGLFGSGPGALARDPVTEMLYIADDRRGVRVLRPDGWLGTVVGGAGTRVVLGSPPNATGVVKGIAWLSTGQLALSIDDAILKTSGF